jgi:hypothetical protein
MSKIAVHVGRIRTSRSPALGRDSKHQTSPAVQVEKTSPQMSVVFSWKGKTALEKWFGRHVSQSQAGKNQGTRLIFSLRDQIITLPFNHIFQDEVNR